MTTFGYCAVQSCGPVATARPALQTIARPGQGSAYPDGDTLITGIVPKRRRINLQQLLMLLPPASNPEDTLLNARAAPSTGAAVTTSSIWPPNTDGPSPNNDESPCYLGILADTQLSLGAYWLVGPSTGLEQGGLATVPGSRCTIANSAPCGASTRGQVSRDSIRTTTPNPSQASTVVSDVKDSLATSRKRGAEMQTADPLPASATRGQLLSRQLAAAAAAAAAAGLPTRRGRRSSNAPVKTDTDTSSGARNNPITTATEQRVAMVKVDTDPFFFREGASPSNIATKRARPPTPPKQHHRRPHQHQLYHQQHQRQQQQQLPPRDWVWNVVPSELSASDRTSASWPTTTEQNPAPSSASLRSNTSPSASQEPPTSALSLLAAAAAAAASCSESAAAPAATRPKQSGMHSTSGWGRLSSSLPPAIAAPSVTTGAPTRSSMSARSHRVPTLNGTSTTGGDEPLRSMMVNMWSPATQPRTTPAPPPRCAVVTTGAGTAPATASRSGATHPPPPPPTSPASSMAAITPINPRPTGCRQAQSAVYWSWKPPVQPLAGPRVPQSKDAMILEPYEDTAAWRVIVQPSGQEPPNTSAIELRHLFQTGYGQQQQQQLSRRQTEVEREVVLINPNVQGPERPRSQQQSAQQAQSAVLKLNSDAFPERTLSTAPFVAVASPPPQQQPKDWSDHKLPRRRQQEVRGAQCQGGCVASVPSRGVEEEANSRAVVISKGQSWPPLDIGAGAPTRHIATTSSAAPEVIKREPEPCAEPIALPVLTSRQQLPLHATVRAAIDATDAADVAAATDAADVAAATDAADVGAATDAEDVAAATDAVDATADAPNDIATTKVTASETAPSEMPAAAVSGLPRTEAPSSSVRGWLPSDANSQPALSALERLLAAAAAAAQAAAAAAAAVGEAVPQPSPHQLPSELLRVEPDGFFEPSGDLLQGDVLQTACRLIRLGRIRPSIAISLPWSEPPATSTAPHQGPFRHTGHSSSSSSSGSHASGAGKGQGHNGGSKLTYGSIESADSTSAATGASQPTAPLFAVLRLLVDFAGAARALQMVEARQRAQAEARAAVADDVVAATEAYRALWPLMRRGRKYAEMLMTKIERTLTDNDDAPVDGDMSSPERSLTTSL